MLRVTIEVGAEKVNAEANRFRVEVRAQSIRQAVDTAEAHYPGATVRVLFPLDPEMFFVKDDVGAAELISIDTPKRLATPHNLQCAEGTGASAEQTICWTSSGRFTSIWP